jgi:hypothetical protein
MNKNIKLMLLVICGISLTGCVKYKYNVHSDGTQIQVGEYMESRDFYSRSHFRCTTIGKQIIEANKRTEEYYRTNRVGDTL